MAYYLNLFSPATHLAFTNSNQEVSGFRVRQKAFANKIKPGDKLICYLTKVSRYQGKKVPVPWYELNRLPDAC